METSFGLLFYLKKPKGFTAGEIPIYVRITVNDLSTEISTKRQCDPYKWNAGAGRLSGKSDLSKELNGYLDAIQQKVFEAKRKLMERDIPITAEGVLGLVLNRG